tara:strand:- start:63 stop:461 length:399 start_codon:yes stop_codon:yes gene_type:complete
VGLGINPELKTAIATADLVILMGGRFSEVTSQNYQLLGVQGASQKLVHIHASAEELGRVYRADLAIHASPMTLAEGLSKLTPILAVATHRLDWVSQCRNNYQSWSSLPTNTYSGSVQMPLIMAQLASTLPAP